MKRIVLMIVTASVATVAVNDVFGDATLLNLGHEEIVQAGGFDIDVGSYSVPSFVDWNNDHLNDLVIGEKDLLGLGKVRVYLNGGAESNPQFTNYFFAQSNGVDLVRPGSGCMGCFPRVVYWDGDNRKDLLIGRTEGYLEIFLNIGTDEAPTFDGGTLLQIGPIGAKTNIDVGIRATPSVVDWNNDKKKDLIVGAYDSKIHIFINEGTDSDPDFRRKTFAQANGSDLIVPGQRSSPDVFDADFDGKKDLLVGNTNGQLLFYSNVATDEAPSFSGYSLIESNGVPIDLSSSRSRAFVCYWTGDGHFGPIDAYPDVLIGASNGNVHLYQGKHEIGDIDGDGVVDFRDFALFAPYWRQTNCSKCGGADLANDDGKVDLDDLRQFAANWLIGIE